MTSRPFHVRSTVNVLVLSDGLFQIKHMVVQVLESGKGGKSLISSEAICELKT